MGLSSLNLRKKTYIDARPEKLSPKEKIGNAIDFYRKEFQMDVAHPFIVTLIENDQSIFTKPFFPIFPGGTSSELHDAIHLILGLGFTKNEEAFVIGFTYGSTKKWGQFRTLLYTLITRFFYPKNYAFTTENIEIFKKGLAYGTNYSNIDLSNLCFEKIKNETIEKLRISYIKSFNFNINDHLSN